MPIFVSGDLFHAWENPAELTNFVISRLDGLGNHIYAVPGNHDLPNHEYGQVRRSSYWTLVESATIIDLNRTSTGVYLPESGVAAWGFGHGRAIVPPTKIDKDLEATRRLTSTASAGTPLMLAVVHRYCWNSNHAHPNARPEDHAAKLAEGLAGYDAAVIGDNHSGFLTKFSGPRVKSLFVNGTLIRRRKDEIGLEPAVGVLYSDGSIKSRFLDTTKDKFVEASEGLAAVAGVDVEALVELMRENADQAGRFVDAVNEILKQSNNIPDRVCRLVLECVQRAGGKKGAK